MELQQLRKFIAVAEHKNISRAARELLISQPALSRSIHELEEELGVKLIQRGRFGVELTQEGVLLLDRGRSLLSMEAGVKRELLSQSAPTIHIVWRCAENFLIDILQRYTARCPGTRFEVLQNDDFALQSQQYDFIISGGLADESGYKKVRLLTERLLCAIPEDHPLAQKDSLLPQEFAALPQIQFGGHRQIKNFISAQLRLYGLSLPAQIVCDDVRTGCDLVSAGFGVLLMPEYAPDDQMLAHLRLLPITGVDISREVYLYRRADIYLPERSQDFAAFLVRYFAQVEGEKKGTT